MPPTVSGSPSQVSRNATLLGCLAMIVAGDIHSTDQLAASLELDAGFA